jgi:hypothetical protein
MPSVPPQDKLLEVLFSNDKCFEYMLRTGIIYQSRSCTKDIEDHLREYIWRKRHKHELGGAFINAIVDVSYE